MSEPVEQIETPAATGKETLPEWAQRELTDVRQEAARYRNEKKEALSAVETTKAEFESKFTDLNDKLNNKELELLKLKAALAAKVPGESAEEFAGLLKGEDFDSLKAHAENVKAMFAAFNKPDAPVDHSQGTGNNTSLNGDPLLESLAAKLGF
jgi:chromosome segregation ATPase